MISVVIPLYNKISSISDTIKSVLLQTYANFEILVINDGSTDGSEAPVKAFKDHRIRLVDKINGGVSSARNLGIKEAKFSLIAFLDGDDLWDASYLENMLGLIEDYPSAGLFGCAYAKIENEAYSPARLSNNIERGLLLDFFKYANAYHLFMSSSVIVRKEVFEEIGGFDIRISCGEDLDMWNRIAANFSIAYLPIPMSFYNLDDDQRALNRDRPLHKHYLTYIISNLKKYEYNNASLREYILKYILVNIRPYYFSSVYKDMSKCLLNQAAFKPLSYLKYRFIYLLPYPVARILYKAVKVSRSLPYKN